MQTSKPLLQHTRHSKILERLNNGELLSITELSKEWNLQAKTLQRDFKKLMEGSYGVVRADDGKRFTLSKKKTTSKDASSAIKILDSLSADIGGFFYIKAQTALKSIQSYIKSPFYTRIDVEDVSDKMELIEQLEQAIVEHKMVSFKYKRHWKPNEVNTYEDVKPYKIIIFDGFFYLFCKHYAKFPKFYLKEISDLVIQDNAFKYEENILSYVERSQGIWFNPNKKPFEVILYLDSVVRVYFERKPVKEQFLKKYTDGSGELTLYVTSKEEVFSILKKWLPHVKVVEPVEMQDEFKTMLSSYVEVT